MANHPPTRNILPVVLAGGTGTRLRPLSRAHYPKQFLRLFGESSLLQQTLLRVGDLRCRAPYVVCNREHRFIAADQCRTCGVDPGALVVEPAGRNTAPAAALAAFKATSGGADPVLFVLPADHYIADQAAFRAAVRSAIEFAETGNIVVFGIGPSHPATAYGYIRTGATASDGGVAAVAAFAEKPPPAVARQYLDEGGWYWNSGMFLFRASVYLDELGRHRPDIHEACKDAAHADETDAGFHLAGDAFLRCAPESIDRAVMEKTDRGTVVPTDMGWSDIGSWDSLAEVLPWREGRDHPWGRVETTRSGDGFDLRRLTIAPGRTLTLTVRGPRSTHWVVVRGLAEVARGAVRLPLARDQSTELTRGLRHSLTNTGDHALLVVEVQTGSQASEDAIVPVEDPDPDSRVDPTR
ncbi:MAG: sugar phosphate nucleotidyltransferase [Gammaproteobacteria bacterium]|nr:sugar phosphate nucleotidyltransferase [Gammaproteobacteria bacterium]